MTDASSLSPDASFEDTLIALQTIVEELEQGNLPLSETISRFEAGTRLAERCQKLVADAELRITVLTDIEEELDDDDETDDDDLMIPFWVRHHAGPTDSPAQDSPSP